MANNRLGKHDVACPECGPNCTTTANRKREVLRVWHKDRIASYNCARCGIAGYAFPDDGIPLKPKVRVNLPTPCEPDDAVRQLDKACWLWRNSQPIGGTPAETYIRTRGIECALPSTLRYLQPKKSEHHPAMIAPFGLPDEPEPGALRMPEERVKGVHLTLLAPDGSRKAGTGRDKLMVGRPSGAPIVLSPPNDGLGLLIAEGIEDALSGFDATGLGAWAGGSAGHLAKLAAAVPAYIEAVTILQDDDPAGQRGAGRLTQDLRARGMSVSLLNLGRAAA